MMRVSLAILFLCLAGCGQWPDEALPDQQSRNAPWPELKPLSDLIAPEDTEITGEEDALRLAARADGLRRRAALLRTPVADEDDFEALRARVGG